MAPLKLKGCTRTPSLCSTTTPSGASERRHCQCFCSPLRPRGRAGVFRRREGPASQSLPGTPPSLFSRLPAGYVRGVSTSGGFAAADPSLVWVRFPYVSAYVFTFAGVCSRWVRVPGRPDVFPGRDRHRVWPSQLICHPHESLIHGDPVNRGVRTSFPGRDREPVRPLCFQGPHSYITPTRPDQRPRARVVRGRLVQRHRLRSGSVGLTTGFGSKLLVPRFLGFPRVQHNGTGLCTLTSDHEP